MAAILDAILDFEECQQGILGDFLSVILHIFLDLSWKNQLVTKNVQVKTNTSVFPAAIYDDDTFQVMFVHSLCWS